MKKYFLFLLFIFLLNFWFWYYNKIIFTKIYEPEKEDCQQIIDLLNNKRKFIFYNVKNFKKAKEKINFCLNWQISEREKKIAKAKMILITDKKKLERIKKYYFKKWIKLYILSDKKWYELKKLIYLYNLLYNENLKEIIKDQYIISKFQHSMLIKTAKLYNKFIDIYVKKRNYFFIKNKIKQNPLEWRKKYRYNFKKLIESDWTKCTVYVLAEMLCFFDTFISNIEFLKWESKKIDIKCNAKNDYYEVFKEADEYKKQIDLKRKIVWLTAYDEVSYLYRFWFYNIYLNKTLYIRLINKKINFVNWISLNLKLWHAWMSLCKIFGKCYMYWPDIWKYEKLKKRRKFLWKTVNIKNDFTVFLKTN